jgi:two-component system, NarL family, nitrate/nitrite response regulator NarL
MEVRSLIVDDDRSFLRAARDLLEEDGISVVGVASTGAGARQACRELRPDVTLVDIHLGEENGFDVARQLAGRTGAHQGGVSMTLVILISACSEDDFAELIAASPARSFLAKSDLSGSAIRAILAGSGGFVAR